MEDDGGRGDKQLKREVCFLYSEMRHPPPRAGLYSHCGLLRTPASPSKGILTFPAPVQFQIYRMCRPRIPSKDMTGAGQQACSFVQNYLDYSALGRKARATDKPLASKTECLESWPHLLGPANLLQEPSQPQESFGALHSLPNSLSLFLLFFLSFLFFFFFFSFMFLCCPGDRTQAFVHARQARLPLRHIANPNIHF